MSALLKLERSTDANADQIQGLRSDLKDFLMEDSSLRYHIRRNPLRAEQTRRCADALERIAAVLEEREKKNGPIPSPANSAARPEAQAMTAREDVCAVCGCSPRKWDRARIREIEQLQGLTARRDLELRLNILEERAENARVGY
jgi:hypothetical protein